MSLAALLQAVRDEIRDELGVPAIQCEVQETGQPPPGMGAAFYIAVHPLGWSQTGSAEIVHGIDESYMVGVTITKRLSATPPDRKAREVWLKRLIGFEHLARRVMSAIHQNYNILYRTNDYIGAGQEESDAVIDPMNETLRWLRTQETPTQRDGSWLWEDTEEGIINNVSETMQITFGQARRVQHTNTME